jgi:hypothetical protein
MIDNNITARLRAWSADESTWDLLKEAADEIERLRAALEKIAQHDMQAIALNALRLNPVRTRPAKEAFDDAAT